MNRDQVKGAVKDVAGKVQEKTGQATGDRSQQAKGLGKQAEGKVQKNVGNAKEVVKDGIDKI
ncbi:MAG TPA: CsbD family protein [Rubrivivax sp.]|nr:CsbD family protein [Rubrivivax sp.]